MKKSDSYEDVMKALEDVNEFLEKEVDNDLETEYNDPTFKWEYAFESVTERSSVYKRRNSNG